MYFAKVSLPAWFIVKGYFKSVLDGEQAQVYTICYEAFYTPKYRSIACACCYSLIPAVADNPLLALIS